MACSAGAGQRCLPAQLTGSKVAASRQMPTPGERNDACPHITPGLSDNV